MWQVFDSEGTGMLDKETCLKLVVEIIGNSGLSFKENIEDIFEI